MRRGKDVVLYGANPGSLSALEYIVGVRCRFARVTTVDALDLLEQAIAVSPRFGCAVIVCKRDEVARLEAFMRSCGGAPTLQVLLGGERRFPACFDTPCTAYAHFDAMDRVLERLRVLCRRPCGPNRAAGAAQQAQGTRAECAA